MKRWFLAFLASSLIIFSAIIYFNSGTKDSRKSNLTSACTPIDISGAIVSGENLAFFEGNEIFIPQIAFANIDFPVLGSTSGERWIEIDLSEQKLRAWEGDNLFLETLVSTGLPWYATPTGEFRIWIKLRSTKMEGGQGKYYYYLPNVPYVMYFGNDKVPNWRGYGLHGTYWHNDFGTQKSHGCVNLPTSIAEQLYYWVSPNLGKNKWSIKSSGTNPGTRVVIHE